MRFDPEKKKQIVLYLLGKIAQNDPRVTKSVAEAYGINQNTVHTYVKELMEQGIIRREKRGKYELVEQKYSYELTRSGGDLHDEFRVFQKCLQPHISGYADNVQRIWEYAFSEMVNNVIDHSGSEKLTVLVRQNYLNTRTAIVDDGVGIFEKIRNYFHYASLDEAICELFKGKLTTDAANHSGEGIFFSSKLMDRFFIFSSGKIFTNNRYDHELILTVSDDELGGTTVLMELSNFSHKQPREVFDLYSDVDGGFTTTRIPLKNIFDGAPVSRSQAKRVCSNLEKFQEVILDFAELDWMGQGFAHQIFVVFQNSHPEIKLSPVNMNEAIAKMHQHVLSSAESE